MTLEERMAEWPKQWFREGHEQGVKEGIEQVVEQLKLSGTELPPVETPEDVRTTLEERLAEWPRQWLRDGREQGVKEGIERGLEHERALLRRLVASRFGAETADRLSGGAGRHRGPGGTGRGERVAGALRDGERVSRPRGSGGGRCEPARRRRESPRRFPGGVTGLLSPPVCGTGIFAIRMEPGMAHHVCVRAHAPSSATPWVSGAGIPTPSAALRVYPPNGVVVEVPVHAEGAGLCHGARLREPAVMIRAPNEGPAFIHT